MADSAKLRRETINAVKARGCVWCGEKRMPCMDLHHLNPHEKEYNIAALVNSGTMEMVQAELKKCVPLCTNCHRVVHSIIGRRRSRRRGTTHWKDFEHFWNDVAPYLEPSELKWQARDFPLDQSDTER